jgi:hypothetical protein
MFFVLKFELILIIGSNNVLTEGAALDRAGLDNLLIDGGKVVTGLALPPETLVSCPRYSFMLEAE